MIAVETINLRIVDTAVDPESKEPVVCYREAPDKSAPLYRVWLYLEGSDVPFVRDITYVLHPTFRDRERRVSRSLNNPNCRLEIWTWGLFEVKGIVNLSDGRRIKLRHELTYDRQFSSARLQKLAR